MAITIPQVVERFANYYRNNCVWGSLHIVLADNNTRDTFVEYCIELAKERGDVEGEELGKILLSMSRTQRAKLPSKVSEFVNQQDKLLKENQNAIPSH